MGASKKGARGARGTGPSALRREASARVAGWLAAARRVPREDYTWVREFEEVSGPTRADSWFWCDLLFRPEASPHCEAAEARHGFHAATVETIDLLRHEYQACGLDLVATEGRNFLVVEVARPGPEILAGGARSREAIRGIARALFADAGLCAAPLCPVGDGGFAVNPQADPLLLARCAERMDGGICGGSLYFVQYKKSPQLIGYLDACQWFDAELRRPRGR